MPLINKPDQISTEVVVETSGVGIRIHTPEYDRDLSQELAAWLIKELADKLVAAAAKEAEIRAAQAAADAAHAATELAAAKMENEEKNPNIRLTRIGDNYSLLRWRKEYAGSYVTHASNGLQAKVFSSGKGQWFAQIGSEVLNEEPLGMKVEAVDLVEKALLNSGFVNN